MEMRQKARIREASCFPLMSPHTVVATGHPCSTERIAFSLQNMCPLLFFLNLHLFSFLFIFYILSTICCFPFYSPHVGEIIWFLTFSATKCIFLISLTDNFRLVPSNRKLTGEIRIQKETLKIIKTISSCFWHQQGSSDQRFQEAHGKSHAPGLQQPKKKQDVSGGSLKRRLQVHSTKSRPLDPKPEVSVLLMSKNSLIISFFQSSSLLLCPNSSSTKPVCMCVYIYVYTHIYMCVYI